MTEAELKERTKAFALRVLKLSEALPRYEERAQFLANQLGRSGTSVGCQLSRGLSGAFCGRYDSKLAIVEEEADDKAHSAG